MYQLLIEIKEILESAISVSERMADAECGEEVGITSQEGLALCTAVFVTGAVAGFVASACIAWPLICLCRMWMAT